MPGEQVMANPRRISNIQSLENTYQTQSLSSLSSLIHFLKKPQALPFLLSGLLLLTWVSLRLQYSPHHLQETHDGWPQHEDFKANLVRFKAAFPSSIVKDKRGWLLNPVSLALNSGVKGGAVSCTSVHLGEIRPGGMRGNHRHYTCNETFVIWGAKTIFRVENTQIVGKGYAEVIINEDEVAVAASSSGTAHALVNIDRVRSTYFVGCQDGMVNYSSSSTDFNVWKDL